MDAQLKTVLQGILSTVAQHEELSDMEVKNSAECLKVAILNSFDPENSILYVGRFVYKVGEMMAWRIKNNSRQTWAEMVRHNINSIWRQFNIICKYRAEYSERWYEKIDEDMQTSLEWGILNPNFDGSKLHGAKVWQTFSEPQPLLTDKQKAGNEAYNKPTILPEALNTDGAKLILQKAINAGLCDTNYRWKKSKALLAYFADLASEYLKLGKGEYDGKAKTSWKPFESLFGISGLSGAKRDYQKTGTLPEGYKDVDNLFE